MGRGRRDESGQELVELAMVLPILLMLLLGLIESGNGYSIKHKTATLSREGANIAARGEPLGTVLTLVMDTGSDIGLSNIGGAIVTRIVVESGEPKVKEQVAYPGYETKSRLQMDPTDSIAGVLQHISLLDGQVLNVVEVVVDYRPLTPLAALLPGGLTDNIYERAIF